MWGNIPHVPHDFYLPTLFATALGSGVPKDTPSSPVERLPFGKFWSERRMALGIDASSTGHLHRPSSCGRILLIAVAAKLQSTGYQPMTKIYAGDLAAIHGSPRDQRLRGNKYLWGWEEWQDFVKAYAGLPSLLCRMAARQDSETASTNCCLSANFAKPEPWPRPSPKKRPKGTAEGYPCRSAERPAPAASRTNLPPYSDTFPPTRTKHPPHKSHPPAARADGRRHPAK